MFNIFDELKIGLAAKEREARLERAAAIHILLSEAQDHQERSRQERRSFTEFLALALKALGTNGQMNWKL